MEIDMESKEYKAIGIVSYGSFFGPEVYTKVSSYVPWIKETLSSRNSSLPERQSISDDSWKWKKEKFKPTTEEKITMILRMLIWIAFGEALRAVVFCILFFIDDNPAMFDH